MRDEIREIVVQAVAGTKDLTQAIDELVDLKSNAVKFERKSKPMQEGDMSHPNIDSYAGLWRFINEKLK